MELDEQIYVNVEELRATCSTKHRGSEETETKLVGTDAVAGEETETWSSFKVTTVCLGVLCFLLLTAVAVIGILYSRDVYQLSRDLANHTAERHQLLVRYQNLTDERDQLQTSFKKAVGTCPDGWKNFGCSCYILSTRSSTWFNSRQQCELQHANLVIINSWREMMFLNHLGTSKFWIGLSRSSSQTQWMWTDGTSLRTTYWKYGYPSVYYSGTQNCVALEAGSYEWMSRSWSNEPCAQVLQWVCEKEAQMSH